MFKRLKKALRELFFRKVVHKFPGNQAGYMFFERGIMPCCGNRILLRSQAEGGAGMSIQCAHCNARWSVIMNDLHPIGSHLRLVS